MGKEVFSLSHRPVSHLGRTPGPRAVGSGALARIPVPDRQLVNSRLTVGKIPK